MPVEDLHWMGAVELGRRIASGDLRSRGIVEALLARIAATNPKLEAFVTVTPGLARSEADAADAEIAAGRRRGPLHGVPYCLKDIVQTKGIRTTVGSHILADWVPGDDATVVTRLREAGAVLLGKVNTHEFAFGATTQNIHGRTRNPWNHERIPGGSSGGSGAAVAAGLAPFSIGSDTAGSIRIPAAFCGISGLKPTFGLVSATGVVHQSYTSDHVGPLAREVEDIKAIMGILAGPDPGDPTCLGGAPPDFTTLPHTDLSGVRIGIPIELMMLPLEPGVLAAFESAKATLASLGANVREVSVPLLADASKINNAIVPPETAAQHLEWAEGWFQGRTIRYHDDVAALLAIGRAVKATDLVWAERARARLRAQLDAMLRQEVDVLLTPTAAITAPALGQTEVVLGGEPHDALMTMIHFLCGFSITGVPALALPAGHDQAGMPTSIQLVAAHGRDAQLLAIGSAFQRATPHHRVRPTVAHDH